MAALSRETVIGALETINNPTSGANIVADRLVSGVVVRDGHVGFTIEVAPAVAPEFEPVRKEAERRIYDLPGVLSVTAVLTAHESAPSNTSSTRSPAPAGQNAGPQRAQKPLDLPGVKSIIAVASGKGGVGKSTVAVNLALALSQLGLKIGLLDADIYGPSIPLMLGVQEKPQADGKKLMPIEKFGLKTMSIGYLIEGDTPMIWRGPMVMSALTQMLEDVQWGELDVLVVDMPPGTGDAQLTLAQRVPLAGAVIVSTPQELALIDARKALAMFGKTRVPIIGIVENMAYFQAPGAAEKQYIFGQGGARATATDQGIDFLGEIPVDAAIGEGSDAGRPIVVAQEGKPASAPFVAIAEAVAVKLGSKERKAPRIVFS